MKRIPSNRIALATIAGAFALSAVPGTQAQDTNIPASRPRSTDERVITGTPTPPPVNSDYRKAAEGILPAVPGAVSPAGRLAPGARPETGDPAVRLQPAVLSPAPVAGMDVAMLVEHAVGMAIESSALRSIAEQGSSAADGPSKTLLDHAMKQMDESKGLLTQAAKDGRAVDSASPTRRFFAAANAYMATLGALAPTTPGDRATVAMINHSVKDVLDSGHIRQFGRAYASGAATEQLMNHARMMHDGGTETVARLAGNGPSDPAAPASMTQLAQRGRDLIEASEQLAAVPPRAATPTGAGVGPNSPLAEPNPGRLTDPRPEIIGGTYATGSQTAGTVTGANTPKAAANPNTIPGQGGEANTRPTGGQVGSRPK